MSFYDEPPEDFNDDYSIPDPPEDDTESLLRDIQQQYGIVDFQDIIVDLADIEDPENIRGVRFGTLEEAIMFLFQIGVLGFSDIITIDDLYVPVVHDSPGVTV